MNDTLIAMKLDSLEFHMKEIILCLQTLVNNQTEELWDSSDIIRNWHISERTLATWRKEKIIDYVKIGGKVWYTPEDRRNFLNTNHVKSIDNE